MSTSRNNLRQIGLALHGFHQATRQQVLAMLLARGVSMQGASQFLAGAVVTSPGDRHALAKIIGALTGGPNVSAMALLVPAVQSARAAARKETPRQPGISALAKQQLAAGMPVTAEADRQVLAGLVIAGLSAGVAAGTGGGSDVLVGGAGRDRGL